MGPSRHPILIAGPTASGKSELAIVIAENLSGVVVNADSMQVYRDLEVLTARPGAADLQRAEHRLFGHVDGGEAYSVGRWAADIAAVLAELAGAGRPAIVVGGTGLYFKALLEGLSPIPETPADVRAHWRGEAARLGAQGLHARLSRIDPLSAERLGPGDTQRLVRALEVFEATGRSLLDWQSEPRRPVLPGHTGPRLLLAPERAWLVARCDRRFDRMLAAGGLDEARALAARGLSPELPVMRSIGVPPLLDHLAGRIGLAEAVDRAKAETRRFAKRQATWHRTQLGPGWRPLPVGPETTVPALLAGLDLDV